METTEGLFMSLSDNGSKTGKAEEVESMSRMIFANMDYNKYDNLLRNIVLDKRIAHHFCFTIKYLLSTRDEPDQFFRTRNATNNIILYSDRGIVKVADCSRISSINIENNTQVCYKDLKVSFKAHNLTFYGFLSSD